MKVLEMRKMLLFVLLNVFNIYLAMMHIRWSVCRVHCFQDSSGISSDDGAAFAISNCGNSSIEKLEAYICHF